jgi:putative transposase
MATTPRRKTPDAVNGTARVEILFTPEDATHLRALVPEITSTFNEAVTSAWGDRTIRSAVDLHRVVYSTLRKTHPSLPSQMVCNVQRLALGAVQSARSLAANGQTVSCPVTLRQPLPYDARSMSVLADFSRVTLAAGKGHARIGGTVVKHKHLRKFLKDGYSLGSGRLIEDRKGRWWLSVSFHRPLAPLPTKGAPVLAADRGLNVPAALSTGQLLGDSHWRDVDRRYRCLQRILQSKGTPAARRKLKRRGDRWSRFRTWADRVLCSQILAGLAPGTVLVLEDLSHIRARGRRWRKNQRWRLHEWSFRRQQEFLVHAALLRGIFVVFVNPAYTSQECAACGHTERKNRHGSRFVCRKCGHVDHADLNAAKVIEKRGRVRLEKGGKGLFAHAPNAREVLAKENAVCASPKATRAPTPYQGRPPVARTAHAARVNPPNVTRVRRIPRSKSGRPEAGMSAVIKSAVPCGT